MDASEGHMCWQELRPLSVPNDFKRDLYTKNSLCCRGGGHSCFTNTSVFIRPSSDGTYYGMVMSVQVSVRVSVHPSVRLSVRPVSVRPFSALFSYMLWHIELKFWTWLCFDVLQIEFDCRHFASIFERVMPLCELRIKVMCSFPHFSPTCFDILSSNFAYDFVSLTTDQVRVPSISVNVCGSYAPFGT